MAGNPFDQFDQPNANPFDQFDAGPSPTVAPQQEMAGIPGPTLPNTLNRIASTADRTLGPSWGNTEAGLQMVTGALAAPVAGIAGLVASARGASNPGDVVRETQENLTYQPRSQSGQNASNVVNKPMQWIAQGADYVGGKTTDLTGSPAAGAFVNTAMQAVPALLLKGRGKAGSLAADESRVAPVGHGVAGRPAPQNRSPAAPPERAPGLGKVSGEAPTKDALRADAKAAYQRAEKLGAVISPESFTTAQKAIGTMLEREGIDPTLHPATTAAFKRISETSGPVTLEKLETLRRIANDAKGTISKSDRRLAAKLIDTLDNYTNTLTRKDLTAGSPEAVAALKEARGFYARASKADVLDQLMKRAELSAPNFSASGMENAVRTEFRSLAKNEKRLRLFSPEEQAAIRRVAQGGKMENALRMLGKLAPTGVVSGAGSTALGFLMGGPVGAGALPAAGAAARYGATRMTLRNAAEANALVRRGPAPKKTPREESRNALAP